MSLKSRMQRIRNAWREAPPVSERDNLADWYGLDVSSSHNLSEVTGYTSLKVLSESMGKLPLKYYQHTDNGIVIPPLSHAAYLLSRQPNPYITSVRFFTFMELMSHYCGNSYAYIDTSFQPYQYGGEYSINGFYPMQSSCVTPMIDDAERFGPYGELYYKYTSPYNGEILLFHSSEVLHIPSWYSEDGIVGQSVFYVLKNIIDGAKAASEYEERLFKSGLTAKLVMQYSSTLDSKEVARVQKIYAKKLTGPSAAGNVVPIPEDFRLTPLNMSLVDAEFSTLKRYNARDIAAAFGVKPSQINDYEHSKYASSESEMLAFLTNTLSYRIRLYEDEINAKVLTPSEIRDGYYYKFNERALLRTSIKEQSEVLRNNVEGGYMMVNEARDKLDMPHVDGGDTLLINGSYVPITQIGAAYEKGGNTGENSES